MHRMDSVFYGQPHSANSVATRAALVFRVCRPATNWSPSLWDEACSLDFGRKQNFDKVPRVDNFAMPRLEPISCISLELSSCACTVARSDSEACAATRWVQLTLKAFESLESEFAASWTQLWWDSYVCGSSPAKNLPSWRSWRYVPRVQLCLLA